MDFILKFFIFTLFLAFAGCHEDDVYTIKLTSENFDEEIPKRNHFVMFYAPWCGHCQRLAPTWEQLAEMLNIEDSNVKIAKVDCTTDGGVCSKQDVTGYPTLKFFKAGKTEGEKFRGTRDLPSLTNFINEQTDGSSKEGGEATVPVTDGGLKELTEDNFEKHVASGKHFVKFYAPWCGHCQKLAPTWDELAKTLENEPSISIAKVDCTQFRSICNSFDVKGYPTLLWIEDGKKVDKYQGQRSHDELKEYVDKMLGEKDVVSEEELPAPGAAAVMVLNGENFNDEIKTGIHLVKFFAPWCGHCKRLAPTWEELGKKFEDRADVRIVKVDCTLESNKDLCNDQVVEGFPTIFLYKNGDKISEYSGSRTLEDLYGFVEKYLGHDEL